MKCSKCDSGLGDMNSRIAFICLDIAGDERIESYWFCKACGFYTLESYRDRFMGSTIVTIDDPIEQADGEAIVATLKACPDPNNKRCSCSVHQSMNR
jgi:hypothetical protein